MATVWLILVMAVCMRFFVFHIKFVKLRTWLRNRSKLWSIFLGCPFCNGFWTGLVMFAVTHYTYFFTFEDSGSTTYKLCLLFCLAVTVGVISYLIEKFFEIFEENDEFTID